MLRTLIFFILACAAASAAQKTADFFFVDVEGGQATLIVSPSGQSLLIDTGWPGHEGRDAERIAAAAKQAGLKKIDYVLITHFHTDHVGGVPQLTQRIPVGTFIDHGPSVEHGKDEDALFQAYAKERDKAKHIEVRPGDTVPLKGIGVRVLTAGGKQIDKPLAGAGEKNALCGTEQRRPTDESENAQSVGTLITFGKFRAVDLGDLTWNKEMDLMCPVNRVGKVDVYIVTHHGMNMSGSATGVYPLAAKVAIMDNGAKKGGTPEAYQVIRKSPGLADIWQLHYAESGGDGNNTDEKLIANLKGGEDKGYAIKLSAHEDGTFSVTNLRSGFSKSY